jgi:transcriptional regulator of acetoin/glycerol metabolism
LSPQAKRTLLVYSWPGNVRELENCIRRACLLSPTATVEPHSLNLPLVTNTRDASEWRPDRAAIENALLRSAGVVALAARELGLSRQALYRRMEKLGLKTEDG